MATLVKVALSLTLLGVLVSRIDLAPLVAAVADLSLGLAGAAFGAHVLVVLLGIVRWRLLLLGQGVEVPPRVLLDLTLVASFFSAVPPASLGADVVRAAGTAPYTQSKTVAIATVLIDRTFGILALLWLAAAASSTRGLVSGVSGGEAILPWLAGGVTLALLAGLLAAPRILRRLARLADRVRLGRLSTAIRRGRESLERCLERPAYAGAAFTAALLTQAGAIMVFWLVARSLSASLPVTQAALTVPLVFLAQALPISIGGIGVREGVVALVFRNWGIDLETALAVSLGWFVATHWPALAGALLFVLRGRSRWRIDSSARAATAELRTAGVDDGEAQR